ncbi:hypothetical protein OIO90_003113 [Microbotryomycetes sp. JL221]|nr:hypothetical protein OIO90_003113 [Microbotryomycetes sp. JL221]
MPTSDTMYDSALYVVQRTGFVPALVAFSIAPAASLKSWLAVRSLPAPLKVDEAIIKRQARRQLFGVIAMVFVVFGTEIYVMSRGSEVGRCILNVESDKALTPPRGNNPFKDLVNSFFRILFAMVYQVPLMLFFANLCNATKWNMHRKANGAVVANAVKPSFVKSLLTIVVASAVNVGAYMSMFDSMPSLQLSVAAMLIPTAMLWRSMSAPVAGKFSVRGVSIYFLSAIGVLLLWTGVMVVIMVKLIPEPSQRDPSSLSDGDMRVMMIEDDGTPMFMAKEVFKYSQLISQFIYNIGPGILLAVLYRFDYAQHISKSGESMPVPEFVDAPTKRASDWTRGVKIAQRAPKHFRKPYFFTGLFMWLIAHVVVFALFTFVPPPPEVLDTALFDVLAMMIAAPLMVCTVVAVAKAKGELKNLWTYTEVWTVKRDASSDAIDQDSLPVEEQVLYHDVKEADALEDAVVSAPAPPSYSQ